MLVNHLSTSAEAYTQFYDWKLLPWGKAAIRREISIKNVKIVFLKSILELFLCASIAESKR